MNLRTRRVLYSFFVALFLIVAPPLVMYTAGYRYNFEYNRIVETGSLVVRTDPQGASLYINNKLINQKSPTIINTILPGKINLLVEKEGYIPWKKEIKINAKVATFKEDIKLYPKYEARPIVKNKAINYWWNEKQNKIAYTTKDGQLRLFNTLNQKDALVANFQNNKLLQFSWSKHDDSFLFGRKNNSGVNEYFVVDGNFLNKPVFLSKFLPSQVESAQWDPSAPDSVYATSNGNLYRIPYIIQTSRLIYSGSVSSFLAEKNRIIILDKAKNNACDLLWISPSDTSTLHLIPEYKASTNDSLIKTNSGQIALIDKQMNKIVVVDPSLKKNNSENSPIIISNAKQAIWSKDGKKLIYTDGTGIYIRSFVTPITVIPKKNTQQLVVRYSNPIGEIAWADNESRVLFTVHDSLRVVKITSQNRPQVVTLLNSAPKNITTAAKAQAITFIDENGRLSALPLTLEQDRRPFFVGNE